MTHNVSEAEVEQVMRGPGEDLPAKNGARMKLAKRRPVVTCQLFTYRMKIGIVSSLSQRMNYLAKQKPLSVGVEGENRDERQ